MFVGEQYWTVYAWNTDGKKATRTFSSFHHAALHYQQVLIDGAKSARLEVSICLKEQGRD